jgi:CubicO group peptidase (beta-lactamase class C family)
VSLAVVLSTATGVLLATYPAEYLGRLIAYQQSDVRDYLVFPERPIAAAAQPRPFRTPADPWAAEEEVRAGLEQDALVGGDLDRFLQNTGTQAFLVIRDDTILYEHYFNGAGPDSTLTSFSAAKSYVSTLVGIAVAEGAIRSVDDPVTRYLPELAARDPRFAAITIRHLLDMTSGLKYQENGFVNGDDALTYYYPDLRELALDMTSITGEPGTTWLYNNYNPLLLGLVLERATGVPVSSYLQTRLWQPLGAEYPASWSLDSTASGFEKMESGINARAIDFAKLGRLYLDRGRVGDRQVLPADWVDAATRMDPSVDRATRYPAWVEEPYGQVYHQRLWWGAQREDGSYAFAAQGNYGQEIFVDPGTRTIIVRNGERYGINWDQWLGLFMNFTARTKR